jgi:hypothetical protein
VSWVCGTKRSPPTSDRACPYVCACVERGWLAAQRYDGAGPVPFAVRSLPALNVSLGRPSTLASGCSTLRETWPRSAFARSTRPSFLFCDVLSSLSHTHHGHPAHTPSCCECCELLVTLTRLACCCHHLDQRCPTRCVCVCHAVVPSYPPCRTDPRSTHAHGVRNVSWPRSLG